MFYRKAYLFATCLVVIVAMLSMSLNNRDTERTRAVKAVGEWYQNEVWVFDSMLKEYPKYFYDSSYRLRKEKYQDLAMQFKRMEGLFTYFHPKESYRTFLLTARFQTRDVGPPFPDNWLFIGPFGTEPDSILLKSSHNDSAFTIMFINRAVTNFRKVLKETNIATDAAGMTEADLFEALRLQMMRMSTIGLSNGDFVVNEAAMPGLQGEFDGWAEMMQLLTTNLPVSMEALKTQLKQKLDEGKTLLTATAGYEKFDRMSFLTEYLIPLAGYLHDLQKALNIQLKTTFSATNNEVRSIYDGGVFNANFFAPGNEAYNTKAKSELGKFLFFDPVISDNNLRACASCHKPQLAFTDGRVKSMKFNRGEDLPRNSPTVINAAFQKEQFWDLRASSLEDQLDSVVNNVDEMHSSFEGVIGKINSSTEYKKLFYTAFPETKTVGIQRKHVKIAIASYERELTGLNSRFDQYVRGDKSKMNQAEINGFNLFTGKAKCASCHYAPLFSAPLPPYFDFTEHRAIGVPVKDTMDVYQVDADTGASKVSKDPLLHFSFKVPTVRNAALTAPYMHNGVYKTLNQVLDFYNHAGGIEFMKQMRPGMKGLPFFMILPIKLNLTNREKEEIIAFIEALTDNTAARKVPDHLPAFTGKYAKLSKRKVGGVF